MKKKITSGTSQKLCFKTFIQSIPMNVKQYEEYLLKVFETRG